MYDRKHRIQVAFDAETVARATGISLEPDTFQDHLEYATEYQLAMYRLGSKSKRDETRPHVRAALAHEYSLMELRALYLFSIAEHENEVLKGGRLNEMQRAMVWRKLEHAGKIFVDSSGKYAATDPENTTLEQYMDI